jgi:Domain of unknown function (DUF4249)
MITRVRSLRFAVALTTTAVVAACGDPTFVVPSSSDAVVRAYLYAGQPVNDIRLTYAVPISTRDTTSAQAAPPITNATVVLVRSGVRYPLSKSAGDSGYYQFNGSGLTIREGEVFTLEATVDGKTLSARTVVPVKPSGARVAAASISIPTLTGGPGGPRPDFSASQTMVRWTRSAGALYFVTLENVEAVPVAVEFAFPGAVRGRRRVIFAPTEADSLPINALGLPYYGRYRVSVWRVNEEYAQLYATLQQDSRDLNEPFTNVVGGLGVFTAFSADTTSVVVVKK